MITTSSPEFVQWLKDLQGLMDREVNNRYAGQINHVLTAEEGSKFIRIVDNNSQRMCWGFVVKCDNETKGLGKVKEGDIHNCATWKAPSKHSRGNILTTGMNNLSWTGPGYLR